MSTDSNNIPSSPYMTPQIEKKRTGLTPSQIDLGNSKSSSASGGSGSENKGGNTGSSVAIKTYRTTSKFLYFGCFNNNGLYNSVPAEGNGEKVVIEKSSPQELYMIVDSIQSTLEGMVNDKMKGLASMKFDPNGCIWLLKLNAAYFGSRHFELAKDYIIQVKLCCEQTNKRESTYVVNTSIESTNSSSSRDSESSFKEIKPIFEDVQLNMRKAVVKCEFPEFPEGCKGKTFREVYQLNARLKSGSFATVCRGTHRASQKKVAIKCVLRKDLPPPDDAAIFDEVAIMASLKHPHICPLIDFFDEKDCYFLVMDLMGGGDLFDRIGKKNQYSEADARDLCIKMFQAMAFCHAKSIAHCDMKPKNLLLVTEDNDADIKLADFGFAARVYEPKSLTKQCGTPFFVSPEILMRQKYDQLSDMWSVGCIVYLLLGGKLPFMGRSQKELFRAIVIGKYDFPEDCFSNVSDDAKDLVTKLLVTDPDKRLSASDALRHRWVCESGDKQLRSRLLRGTSQRLKTFNARMKLRSAMIAVDAVGSLKRGTSFRITKKNSLIPNTRSSGLDIEDEDGIKKLSIKEGDEEDGQA